MTDRKRRFPVFWIGVFALLGPAATAPGQTIVVTAKSVNDLVEDFEHLLKTVAPEGDPRAPAAIDALEQFKSGEMVKGLDRSRGFGLAVTLPGNFPEGGPPSVVAAVPVTDLGQFLDSLKGLGLDVDDKPGVAGFSHKVTAPDGNTNVFVLESKGYALFSLVPDGADRLKGLDPSSWRPKGRAETTLSARVRLSEIPDALKEQVLTQMEAQAGPENERKPGEKEDEYKARRAGQEYVLDSFKSLVKDGDTLELDLDVSRQTSSMAIELAMTAKPGTEMAKTLRGFGGQRSRFEGLGHDAAVAGWARFPVAKALRDAMSSALDQGAKDGLKDMKTDEEKKLFTRLMDLVKSNLDAPEMDLGMAIQLAHTAGTSDSKMVLLSAMRVKDGREFERLVREAVEQIKPKDGVKVTVKWDVARAGDGTAVHQFTAPVDKDDADVVKHFGKPDLFFAFRNDAILASFGEGGLAPLRRILEGASAPARSESDGPVAIVAHMATLGVLAEKNPEAFRKATAEVFRGDAPKKDRLYFGLKGEGDGLRLRLVLDVPALKLLAILGDQAKK
jgi:hypothetical protein